MRTIQVTYYNSKGRLTSKMFRSARRLVQFLIKNGEVVKVAYIIE